MDKVVVIAGPTASGKTDIGIELALKLNGEIISADSMQIYRGMDIGTAKPTVEERRGIRHYMIDIVNPDEDYSVAQFKDDAMECIKTILSKNKTPIVVGGTGLYINSLVYNITFTDTITDWDYREKLNKIALEKGTHALHDYLRKIDPKSAVEIHPNNVKRVIRALEVYKLTGKPISEQKEESRKIPPPYDYRIFGLEIDRETLYRRIDARADKMLEEGLYEEVEELLNSGYSHNLVSLQGIGYKEIVMAIKGKCSLFEAVDNIKKGTRNLAKRQMTWFRKTEGLNWIKIEDYNTWAILKIIEDNLNNKN
jgi:tRNA dimethylallyltransferase